MDENKSAEHILNIDSCNKVSATSISSVDSFSDRQILLTYSGGRIAVFGSGMKIANFSKSSGAFLATGNITAVKYLQKSQSLKQKLFK